jgi:signal transduction histidine kinase
MFDNQWRKIIAIIVSITTVLVLVTYIRTISVAPATAPQAGAPIIALDGPWQFYWDELLTPADFAAEGQVGDSEAAVIMVPSSWVGQSLRANVNGGQPLPRFGVATYRLQTTIPDHLVGTQLQLLIDNVGAAHHVWVNGVDQGALGEVATIVDGQIVKPERPDIRIRMIDVPAGVSRLDIVMQVSNYTFRDSGIFGKVRIGDAYHITLFLVTNYLLRDVVLASFILLIGIYQIVTYLVSRRDRTVLWLACLCFSLALRMIFLNKFLSNVLMPQVAWDTVMHLQYTSKFVAMFCYINLLYGSLQAYMSPRMHHLNVLATVLFVVYIWISPLSAFVQSFSQQTVFMIAVYVYYASVSWQQLRVHGTIEQKINVLSQVMIIIAVLYDYFLFTTRFASTQFVPIATLVLLFCQAVIISLRYAQFQNENLQLTEDLKEMNRNLEAKVQERTEALNASNAQLAALNQQRTQLMANIAHDMGSPVAGVQSSLVMLTDGSTAHQDRNELVAMLQQRVAYLKHLIDGLFDLSLLESKQQEFDWEHVRVSDVYADISREFAQQLHAQSRELHGEHIAPSTLDAHAMVRIDRRQLHRVIQNLVDNAVKHSTALAPIELNSTVRWSPFGQGGMREWYVEVVDYGVGIDPSFIPMIFQRYYSGQHLRRNGSGLGLAIAKEIIERHGGVMSVHSEPGRGSVFAFVIPLVD